MDPLIILQNQFGYSSFRKGQEAIIQSVLKGNDTFVLMPTGAGKSLCYQIPALLLDGLTIVISPLIALMKDQVDALRLNGIEAAFLNSTQTYHEQEMILGKVKGNKLKLLYLAPEKLINGDQPSPFFDTLISFKVSLIAIDEAHCISHWGHDFRPEYLMLAKLKRALPSVPVIALTATADRLTQKDILEKLELTKPAIFLSSFNRSNIRYSVESKKENFEKLLSFLESRKDESGIIYCLSRKSTETLAENLTREGFHALPYHAGLEREVRSNHQEMFQRDTVKIIVATIAFGMGIDKSNVRYVVHMDLPKNMESYYQETGRAGRDGLESEALLFYSAGDVIKLKKFAMIENNPDQTKILLKKLDQMGRFGELTTCRRKYILNYFDETAPDYCGNCDVCLTLYEIYDGSALAKKVLEAVQAVQEKFGIGYLIDFLRGSSAARIEEEHKMSSAYGSGSDTGKDQWHSVVQDMVGRGLLLKTPGIYPVLKMTEAGIHAVTGSAPVMLSRRKERMPERLEAQEAPETYETKLLIQLKDLRRQLALKENVPAYIVLSDASLVEMATYLPHTRDEFSRILGFGQMKLEKYGKQFRNIVAAYCLQHNLSSRMDRKVSASKRPPRDRQEKDNDTKQQTLLLFNQGRSVAQIAELRNLSPTTIESHLAFYIQQGKIPVERLVDREKIPGIQRAIERIGGKILSPIKQSLGDDYTFGEIRYVMAFMESLKAKEPEEEYVVA